jgi:hypothetical protein
VQWPNGDREWHVSGVQLNETIASFIENGLISFDEYLQSNAK